jgi:AcrR family transcriptional regulator
MTETRTRRSDAVANRGRVLDAAEAVFAAKGASASTEEIAQRAGVGIGTVFRHFPTKDELLGAVLRRILGGLTDTARDHLDDPDPGTAFFEVLERIVAQGRLKRVLAAGLSTSDLMPPKRDWVDPLREALAVLLQRAKEAGAVRRDIGIAEVMVVVAAAAAVSEYAGSDRALEGRSVAVMLDGLRPADHLAG